MGGHRSSSGRGPFGPSQSGRSPPPPPRLGGLVARRPKRPLGPPYDIAKLVHGHWSTAKVAGEPPYPLRWLEARPTDRIRQLYSCIANAI